MLHSIRRPHVAPALASLGLALVLAACGGTASPTPVATSTPVATATPAPTATVAPSPTAGGAVTPVPSAAAVDPTEDLAIDAPFTLEPLAGGTGELMRAAIAQQLGSLAGAIPIGARQVSRDGTAAGFVLAIDVSAVPGSGSAAFTDAMIQGLQGAAGAGEIEQQNVAGVSVSVVEQAGQSFAIHQQEGLVLMSFGTPASATLEIAEALITAQ